jgi:hypothetical protein
MKNPKKVLEKNPDKIAWCFLSLNPNAIQLLKQNPDKIAWFSLPMNPNAVFKKRDVSVLWILRFSVSWISRSHFEV